MTRSLLLVALLALAACATPEPGLAPVILDDVSVAAEAAPARTSTAECLPGEGDGIGGTGCASD